MGKRRTRDQKVAPHHHFTVSWSPEAKKEGLASGVKGQITRGSEAESGASHVQKSAVTLAKQDDSRLAKRAILRSLLLVSFILALELVIYLAWQ